MLADFERHAINKAQDPFFYFEGLTMTYGEARLRAAGLARALKLMGVRPGSVIAADMPNCPALVLLYVAAAYGSFSLVFINNRWSEQEKQERLELIEAQGKKIAARFTEETLNAIIHQMGDDAALLHCNSYAEQGKEVFDPNNPACYLLSSGTSGTPKIIEHTWASLHASCVAFNARLGLQGEELWQLSLPLFHVGGLQIVGRCIEAGASFILYRKFNVQKLLDDLVEYLPSHISVVNKSLRDLMRGASTWKPTTRAETSRKSLKGSHARQEQEFTPQSLSELLADTLVVGRHGKETAESRRESRLGRGTSMLAAYDCILLGGSAPDQGLIEQARECELNLYTSYGSTETASAIAAAGVCESENGFLKLFQNCEAKIKNPNKQGFGELWVRTPSLCKGYLGMPELELQQVFDAQGFFKTGDMALLDGRSLLVAERTEDLFISGGENIYPQEIAQKLQRIVGVSDAYVFAIDHPVWGKRPVACVEKDPEYGAAAVYKELSYQLPRMFGSLNRPDKILVLDQFPRISIGKIDKRALKACFAQALGFESFELELRMRMLKKSLVTAQHSLESRPSLFMQAQVFTPCIEGIETKVLKSQNKTTEGDGAACREQTDQTDSKTSVLTSSVQAEGVAFETGWYFPETIPQDKDYLQETLIPFMDRFVFADPHQAFDALLSLPGAATHPLALSMADQLYWKLFAAIQNKPLWACLQEAFDQVAQLDGLDIDTLPCNTVFKKEAGQGWSAAACALGIDDMNETHQRVEELKAQGYQRIKLKVSPNSDFAQLKSLVEEHPDIAFSADANQSFDVSQQEELAALDRVGFIYVEEPLKPQADSKAQVHLKRLEELARTLSTPLALDESLVSLNDHTIALQTSIPFIILKPAKLGGLTGALRWYIQALKCGKLCVLGGFFEGALAKQATAAFQALPGFTVPGDFTCPSQIFTQDQECESLGIKDGWIPLDLSPDSNACQAKCAPVTSIFAR